MPSTRRFVPVLLVSIATLAGTANAAVHELEVPFQLDEWIELEASDGPVTLHRFRIERKEGRLTKSAVLRPHNQEYLATVSIQLEYTNEDVRKWSTRINARWADEDGETIDGFSANEKLGKQSARKVTSVAVPTLRYGLTRATTLFVEIHYEP